MRNRKRMLVGDDAAENFWPSFTDLTSTIALILFVLVLLAYLQSLITGKKLEHARTQLDASQRQITSSMRALEALRGEIALAQQNIAASRQKIDEQKTLIEGSNQELTELRSSLQGIAVLRLDVLQRVKQAIEAELSGTAKVGAPLVLIADNGNIVINESLVFEYDSYTIKLGGKRLLDTLARAFAKVLSDAAVRDNVDVILVQGHTDERGAIAYNRELSAKRANAVLDYMFDSDATLAQVYGRFFASSAYSEFRPVDADKTEAAYERNRRIEISVVLKDAGVRGAIDEYLRNLDPVFAEPAAAP
jgi:chemotaxis protein MotB